MTGSSAPPLAPRRCSWPAPGEGTRWLLRLPNWVGDAVMVLPALRALPRDGQRWVGIAHRRVVPLYEATGWFETCWPAPGAWAPVRLARRVRRYAPERVLVFPPALTGRMLARLSGAALRLGTPDGVLGRRLVEPVGEEGRDRPLHETYLAVARAAGGTPAPEPDFRLPVPPDAAERVERRFPGDGRRRVALAPGAAYGPSKRWPVERFAELARRLSRAGEEVVVVGGKGERELGETLAREGARDLTGRTGLVEAVALLRTCAVVVSNDSGAMHLARAAGTAVVALFGSSSPRWTGPLPGEGIVLWRHLPCSPCFRRRCPLSGDRRLACLRGIEVDEVEEAVRKVADS